MLLLSSGIRSQDLFLTINNLCHGLASGGTEDGEGFLSCWERNRWHCVGW